MRKVPRKVFAEGSADVFVEGVCERFLRGRFPKGFRKDFGRFWAFGPAVIHPEGFLRKVRRKVFAEGSAEGFCGRFRGRLSEGFSRKEKRKVLSINITTYSLIGRSEILQPVGFRQYQRELPGVDKRGSFCFTFKCDSFRMLTKLGSL